jgi:site-specific recombinase XerD
LEFYLLSLRAERRRPATLLGYRKTLRLFIRFLATQGVTTSQGVTIRHIRLWMLGLERNLAPASFCDYVVAVKAFFRWLHAEGVIPIDPAAGIKVRKPPQKVVQVFSTEELNAMLEVCNYDEAHPYFAGTNWLGLRNKALLLVAITTGLRASELSGMRLSDFLSDYRRIKVVGAKSGRERIVALDHETLSIVLRFLLARRKLGMTHDYVWAGMRGGHLSVQELYNVLRSVGSRAGVKKPRFVHALRHTAGTRSLQKGASEREVGDMLGHTELKMVRLYTATIGSEQAADRHEEWAPTKGLRIK